MDDHSVVQVWREINGVTDDGDFACFFSSFEEAKQEVGDLIAFAWQQARQQAEGGVDKVVQAMLAREEKPSPPAPQVRQPAPSIKVKPSSAPRVVRQAAGGETTISEGAVPPVVTRDCGECQLVQAWPRRDAR